ncbi:hypothetical protein QA641_32905 [Bradyrhizobium sp. CB1650]|uniref:hypothetical protein n=1 Tax=Bradyrhizobium sp. CB1650 TaxID=3039153 RepID=UPI002435E9AF|nr:hypothetical protein [Bradyrhizobium sp. CB1650]WGD50360.1 hypothetical protein QA641_32905 [Bradyrhizobium sp. CB1650]
MTERASRGSAVAKTSGAVWHCYLLLVLSWLFVDHPFSHLTSVYETSFIPRLQTRTIALSAQLNAGNRQSSKGTTERYKGFMAIAVKADSSAIGTATAVFIE